MTGGRSSTADPTEGARPAHCQLHRQPARLGIESDATSAAPAKPADYYYIVDATATVTTTSDSKNGSYQYGTTTTNAFAWWDGAVQSSVTLAKTSQPTYTTTYSYGGSGQLASIYVADGRPRTITFTTDMLGQVVRRDEADNVTSGTYSGDPHEIWYRFNGRQIAYTGNNGTYDTDYAGSIAARTKAPAGTYAFRNGDWSGPTIADYDPSLEHINSFSQGGAGGGYVVRAGDTLAGIAQGLWGDASLWYKLAEANGLSGAAGLVEGRSLIVPAGVQANQHNASTFKPYDPADVLGDTSPTTPKPQKKGGKCGTFGQILLVVIAVAVSALTYGALAPHMAGFIGAVVAGAVSGAAGSIVSQGFGVATGIQDKFSFKGVALAAIGGAVGGAMKGVDLIKNLGALTNVANDVANGAISNAASQGIGMAVGLQKKFDFIGVAVAGAVSGAVGVANRTLAAHGIGAVFGTKASARQDAGNFANQLGSGMAGAIVGGAMRSLATGTSFGDNVLAALPDVIGSTIGNMAAGKISSVAFRRSAPPGYGDFPFSTRTQYAEMPPIVQAFMDFVNGRSAVRSDVGGPTWHSAAEYVGDIVVQAARLWQSRNPATVSVFSILSNMPARIANAINTHVRRDAGDLNGSIHSTIRAVLGPIAGPLVSIAVTRPHVAGDFVHGAVLGDFSNRTSLAATSGKIVGGFIPVADIRDLGAAGTHIVQGRPGAWTDLGLSALGAIPLIGDLGKGALKHGDEVVAGVRGLSNSQPDIVYRGLSEADANALSAGLGMTAKAPNGSWSAAEHVANAGPGRGGAAANSPWISTSRRLDVANAYDSGHGVVAIDLNKVDSLQVEVWRTAPRLNGQAGLPYHRSIWGEEVTIKGTIPRDAIVWPR